MSQPGMVEKSGRGRFLEDFGVGQQLRHAPPRTVTTGDVALYLALYGSRFALNSCDRYAAACGHRRAPLDDWLVFHLVLGATVSDISVNALANLGYAEGRFLAPVYPGDSLRAESVVLGLRPNKSRTSGIVYVRTSGWNQDEQKVLEYTRWVMVRSRSTIPGSFRTSVPELAEHIGPDSLARPLVPPSIPAMLGRVRQDSGCPLFLEDYAGGEKIDHIDGVTIGESEHMMATRLYQNTARVHFNAHAQKDTPWKQRLVYGGCAISLARSLSFNGLGSAATILGLNGGRHSAPLFAGDTLYAWSEIVSTATWPGRDDHGCMRIRTRACKNSDASGFPVAPDPSVVLELDYWAAVPRRRKETAPPQKAGTS